jgi:eukaryotic-like serine/threonine-protein kinase
MRDDPGTIGAGGESASDKNESRAELGSTNEYRAFAAQQAAERLICPSCHHTLESGDFETNSVHCEKCGGSFRLEKLVQESTIDAIRVIGRFQLLDAVGQGSFGTVWRARDTQLDRVVALKIPHPSALESGLDAERLGREARIAAQLRHPGIVRLYEMLTLENVPVLVSDFIEGLPLKDLLKIRRLTFREAALIVAQIAESLDYAHERGLVHRDIKPANIMIEYGAGAREFTSAQPEKSGANGLGNPIVVDFGLALRPEAEIVMTVEGQVLGTPAYMSPEQAAGHSHRVDRRSDIYSLGVVLYQLLCGELPFRGSKMMVLHQLQFEDPRPPRRVNDRIPRDLETICLKALAKAPSRRYATAGELALDLRRYLRGEPCRARPVGRLERLALWARRNPSLAWVSAATCASLIAVAVFGLLLAVHETRYATALETRMAENYLDRGLSVCQGGETARGMLLLAEGLSIAPRDARDLSRVLRTNLAAWHTQLDPLLAVQDHGGPITALAFSRDGKLAATGGQARTVRLWDGRGAQPLADSIACNDAVRSLVFSPDSAVLAIVSRDGKLQFWDTRTHRFCPAAFAHGATVHSIVYSRDGKIVAVQGEDHALRFFSTEHGRPLPPVLALEQRIKMASFAPDDKTIVTLTDDGMIQLWDATTGKKREAFANHRGLMAADLSRDGRWLATGSGDRSLRIWDASSLKLQHEMTHTSPVRAVAFSPDCRTVLTGCFDKSARLWDASTGESLGAVAFHRHGLSAVAFNPDGSRIVTCDTGGVIQLRLNRSTTPRSLEIAHRANVGVVRFSPDGRTALTATKPVESTEAEVQLWEVSSGRCLGRVTHSRIVTAAIFSPDGGTVATASADHTALLVDAASGKVVCPPMVHPGWVIALAFNPQGTRLLTACEDGNARLWEVSTGRCLDRPLEHDAELACVAFSPSGALALTAGAFGTAKLWDLASGSQRHVFQHGGLLHVARFSPDGKIVLTAGEDATARLWDVESGRPIGTPLRHQDAVTCALFSPGGETVLTGSKDNTAQLWRVATTSRFGPALAHQGPVLAVAYSPDRVKVATACGDGTARLWDLATGRPLGPALRHRNAVNDLAFSPDGHRLITGSSDHSARIWVLPERLDASPQRLALWVKTLSGMELTGNEALGVLSPEVWEKRRQNLAKLGGRPTSAQ